MNQRKIDDMIPIALNFLASPLEQFKNIKTAQGKIKSKYAGYIASFGPSVIQAGIAKTLAFYVKPGEADREIIAEFIKYVLIEGYSLNDVNRNNDILSMYLVKINGQPTLTKLNFRNKILEAATACKLAMLTYKIDEEDQHEH